MHCFVFIVTCAEFDVELQTIEKYLTAVEAYPGHFVNSFRGS